MQLFGRRYRVDWGHLVLVSLMMLISVAYLLDARSVSLSIQNLIMVQPTAMLVVGLYLFILPQCFVAEEALQDGADGSALREILDDAPRVGSLAMALLLYGLFYESIGFDIASFLFIVAAAFICGERRPLVLLVFAVLGTVFIVYAARFLVATPVPTSFL